jgi:GntR family transcriptional regulator
MRRRGLRASSQILETGEIKPTPADVETLLLNEGEKVVLVERLRLTEGTPMAIERVILHPSCAAVLSEDLAATSLHAAVERLGRIPTRAQSWVTARTATPREKKLLDLTWPAVLLVERRVIADQDGVPIEHTETRYVAERYVFEAVMHRDDRDVME